MSEQRKGPSILTQALAAIGALTVALAGYLLFFGPSSSLVKPQPNVLFDEDMAVAAGGWQVRSFSLPSTNPAHPFTPVQVAAQGKQDTEKGFYVYLLDAGNCALATKGQRFDPLHNDFTGTKIRAYTHTGMLLPGAYCVFVQNSENMLDTATVHLKVVTNPVVP